MSSADAANTVPAGDCSRDGTNIALTTRHVIAGKWRRYQSGGKRYTPWRDRLKNFGDLFRFLAGFGQSFFRLLVWRPNAIFLKGGFVSLPVGLAAAALRIPFVIHESDIHMGLTNRILARYAVKIATGLPLTGPKMVYVGVPVADSWECARLMSDQTALTRLAAVAPALAHLKDPLVVVVGGSLGARHLTELTLSLRLPATTVILGGPHAEEKLKGRTLVLKTLPVEQGLPELLRLADVVVARAGATTLSELAILGKPVIIVPKDVLPGGHQTGNAARLAAAGAALSIPEDDIDEQLGAAVKYLLTDAALRRRLVRNFRAFSVLDASDRITDLIEQVTEQKPNRKPRHV
jgi:UDP-N-acetylglucosamine--N-acetylmuramyl-(pentapeptide) pyrophosphoryl-undecaprenol N-acetylglucosamine transferase